MPERITYDTDGHVVRLGLNRPEKKNAFDLLMLRELAEAYTAYDDDDALWCAVVYPHGADLTAGLDLGEVGPAIQSGMPLFPKEGVDPLGLTGRVRKKPVIIAGRGWCLTLGTELALASDMVVAGHDAKFGQIEVKRGIFPFGGGTIRLPRVAGWQNAMRYLLTGDIFDAAEAHRIGLVQDVVAPDDVVEVAVKLAQKVVAQAPLAVQASLASSWAAVRGQDATEAERLVPTARYLMSTEDAQEGLQSFLERRDAKFSGR
ncbi:MAG: crotonase/enoyl-CoA hydratase family protein [Myxococcota bacterium]